jgi:hypothetical protein
MKRKAKADEPRVVDRLASDFTKAIEAQWREHGEAILDAMRAKDPTKFAELVARLIPPEPPPASPFAQAKSERDGGRVLLQIIGTPEWAISDELADRAVAAHDRFVDELKLIAADAEN